MTAVNRLAAQMRRHFHDQRADLFMNLMAPVPGDRILDLGSGWGDPFAARIARRVPVRVTLADVTEGPTQDAERLGFTAVLIQEGAPLPFPDDAFDIVICNSVIEHVTLPKAECLYSRMPEQEWTARSLAAQRAFAAEIRRVGKRYFVQTPHRHFPIDAHLWLPFTNWLPHRVLRDIVPVTDRFWLKKVGVADWHLLDRPGMQELFPDAGIHVERMLGVPKSIVAYR